MWKASSSYTAYYEVEGVTSINFEFSIATKDAVPDTFYFVVEKYVLGVKPVVRVTATISWVEKASIYDCSEYFTSPPILIIEESKEFRS